MSNPGRRSLRSGALSRIWAMFVKELIQLRRDRVTFATMISVPLMQLMLFGFAINTNPKHLPTGVLLQEESDVSRAILAALANTTYFDVKRVTKSEAEFDHWLRSGEMLFAIEIPAGFERSVRRGDMPALLVDTDNTDPIASGTALGTLEGVVSSALAGLHGLPPPSDTKPAFEVRQHRRYNPAAVTQLNIVPGLLGTILTMTMLIFTGLSVTREVERGTMESLLAMPLQPVEIMLGKILPYVLVGFLQAGIIIGAGAFVFEVPVAGSVALLTGMTLLFITTNLAVGYTFSTLARTQLQAMQMSIMWFLPSMLLSGFFFPFAGMPGWAQAIGNLLPLTHYLRIVRGIMLKAADLGDLGPEAVWLIALTLLAMSVAVARFRRTLE